MQHDRRRRQFLRRAAAALAAPAIWTGRSWGRGESPTEKLDIAVIGVGGRGSANLDACAGENIAALCDVDERSLKAAAARFPAARKYIDFRKLLETERRIDAVVVSTPDHMHAPITLRALERGLHVYCEKPLTRLVGEARRVTELARAKGVVTQMGTQTSTAEENMRAVELLQAGAIGAVREVHIRIGSPGWAQGDPRPAGEDPVPPHLHWDLWLGAAPARHYVETYREGRFKGQTVYHPFCWRGWWDFGTGMLGDQCCHQCNVVFWALDLGSPSSVEAVSSAPVTDGFPDRETITFRFPARGGRPPVKMVWYDGGNAPPREIFAEGAAEPGKYPAGSHLFVGEKGQLLMNPIRLLPRKAFEGHAAPPKRDWGRVEVHEDWLRGIRSGKQPACNFGYSGPMAEALLLGNVALRIGGKIDWDPEKFEVPNNPEANRLIRGEYRKGWEA